MNENTRRSVTSPAGLGSSGVESTHVITDSAASGKTGTGHFKDSVAGAAAADGAAHYSGAALVGKLEPRGVLVRAASSAAADRLEAPLPLGSIRLQPDGRCGCRACLLADKVDELRREEAWASMVYDLGLEALRAQALRSVAPFLAEFEAAS